MTSPVTSEPTYAVIGAGPSGWPPPATSSAEGIAWTGTS